MTSVTFDEFKRAVDAAGGLPHEGQIEAFARELTRFFAQSYEIVRIAFDVWVDHINFIMQGLLKGSRLTTESLFRYTFAGLHP